MMSIIVRPAKSIADFQAIEWLQAEIWGAESGITPLHFLLTLAKEGSIVLLALDDDRPVGFVYGFMTFAGPGRLKHASHHAGVLAAYQDSGVGYRLKMAQREAILGQNLDHITWTFDPLQGRNARFNMRKLGASCNRYLPNLYGEMDDGLNRGLPTDRFQVDWWISSRHVAQRLNRQQPEPDVAAMRSLVLNPGLPLDNNLVRPPDSFASPEDERCLVEFPAEITRLKQEAPSLALAWRMQTREIFETAFKLDYTVVDLLRDENRNFYLN